MAKLVETKLQATPTLFAKPPWMPYPKGQSSSSSNFATNPPPIVPHFLTPKTLPPLLPTPPNKLALPAPSSTKSPFPIKYLTPVEQDARRAKGLCFNCDERFHRGHHCKAKIFLLLLIIEDDDEASALTDLYLLNQEDPPIPSTFLTSPTTLPSPSPFPTQNTILDNFHLSLQAILGQPALNTLRLTATLLVHLVSILIDTGSSHNILQNSVTKILHIVPIPTDPFKVMLGNGAYIEYARFCPNIPLVLQSTTFQVP